MLHARKPLPVFLSFLDFGGRGLFLGATDASSRELSHGHGLKGACFRRVFENVGLHAFSIKWRDNFEFISGLTGVPFGRKEASMGADDAPFRELSHGHGLRGAWFHGSVESSDFRNTAIQAKKCVSSKPAQ